MKPPTCPYCKGHPEARLVDSNLIYNRNYGKIWLCVNYPSCGAWVGTHKGDHRTPLGTLADGNTRQWRYSCHNCYDWLWKSKHMTRTEAYKLMQEVMGLKKEEAHIGMFTTEQCRKLIGIVFRIANGSYND